MQTGSTNDNQNLRKSENKHAVPNKTDAGLSQHGGEGQSISTKSDYSLPQHGGEQTGK